MGLMRYLGIDYGDKRIGVALSDPEGQIAFPKTVILNIGFERVIRNIKSLVEIEKAVKIVIGLPLAMDGKETDQSQKVRNFVEALKKEINAPIIFENELLTTHLAKAAGVKKEHTDEAAAALILQSYLDKEAKN